ncbi:MAG: enolase C-terminal domain-like protein [Thermovirgaceae bacterium]|nr:enolase C-terminal domain-like protein [Thermovirgaceae bacterium]
MRIVSIEIIETCIPLRKPYKLSKRYGYLENTKPVIIKINTDEGISGYGETDPMARFTGETPETVAAVLKTDLLPAILGEDPTNLHLIHETLDSVVRHNHMAKGAIDMACYDLLGKVSGMPLYCVLGGALYENLPIMGSIGGGTIEETVAAAKAEKDKGYHSLMIKVGGDPVHDGEIVLAIRDSLGKDYPLIVDANQGYDVSSALKFIGIARQADPLLFEQPIDAENIEGIANIRKICGIPISVDESLMSYRHAQEVIRLEAADVFSIKVCKNGGIKSTLQIIELARSKNIDILFNSMIEEGITQAASLHIALTTPNLFPFGHAYFSPLRLAADITDYSSNINEGKVYPPKSPGLGVKLLEDVLETFTTRKEIFKKQ